MKRHACFTPDGVPLVDTQDTEERFAFEPGYPYSDRPSAVWARLTPESLRELAQEVTRCYADSAKIARLEGALRWIANNETATAAELRGAARAAIPGT